MLRGTVLSSILLLLRPVSRLPTQPDKRLAACDSVTRALLPACVRVTERQPPHPLDASRPSTARPRHTYTSTANQERALLAGKTRAVTTHHHPIVPLNPSCALPALAQPLSLSLILVPENPCSKRVLTEVYGWQQQQQHEHYCIALADLTLSPHLRIFLTRIHINLSSHMISK